ncbi:MAG: alginate lyase family protein, partial [Chloroflexi bacterium]|nr:alginate lyase family protein [Chloroflexota bacterium]
MRPRAIWPVLLVSLWALLAGVLFTSAPRLPQPTSTRSPTSPAPAPPAPGLASTPSPTYALPTRRPTAGATTASTLPQPYRGLWLGGPELAALPTSGPAWENLLAGAAEDTGEPRLRNQDDDTDVYVLAKALVYARTGDEEYRAEVLEAIEAAMGTEERGRTLALGRNLVSYVIAADLVNLPADPALDGLFHRWLRSLLMAELSDRTLRSTHEERPNNWGSHAGAARVAIALYLGDDVELAQAARVFKGYLGDRDAYADFQYGELWWQADPLHPVGINPPGAMLNGHLIGGAQPEEMRRGGPFQWPPEETGYPWEALQGAIVQAQLLYRAGYNTWEWQDQALRRAAQFLYDLGWPPTGDDEWQPWLLNYAYGPTFPATTPARPGKNMGWTDWTHSQP